MKPKEYAIYKGDKFLYIGTAKECAKYFGVKVETIHFIATKTYKERMKQYKCNNYKFAIALNDKEELE